MNDTSSPFPPYLVSIVLRPVGMLPFRFCLRTIVDNSEFFPQKIHNLTQLHDMTSLCIVRRMATYHLRSCLHLLACLLWIDRPKYFRVWQFESIQSLDMWKSNRFQALPKSIGHQQSYHCTHSYFDSSIFHWLLNLSCLETDLILPDVLIFGAVKCLKEVKSRFWFTSKMLLWCVWILRIRTKSAHLNNYKRTKITIWHVIIIFRSEIAILVRFSLRNYWSRVEL